MHLSVGQTWTCRIDQQRKPCGRGDNLMQELQLKRSDLQGRRGRADEVATRPVETGDKSKRDRYQPPRRKRSECSRSPPSMPAPPEQLMWRSRSLVGPPARQRVEADVRSPPGPTIFYRYILTFGVACFLQTAAQRNQAIRVQFRRVAAEEPNYRHGFAREPRTVTLPVLPTPAMNSRRLMPRSQYRTNVEVEIA